MKICLLGPSYPYRGGISHYMTLLAGELKRRGHDVVFFGFTRQYPAWIYPGRTDRDPSRVPLKTETHRVLDSLNPLSWVRTAQRIHRENPVMLVIPWWTSYWFLPFFTVSAVAGREDHIRVVFICHNVIEHESNLFKEFCTRFVLKLGDALIVHSTEDRHHLESLLPGARIYQSVHPSYHALAPDSPGRERARKQLDAHGKVLLFFGFIRPYKGLEYALRSVPIILEKHDVTLIVAGEFWKGKQDAIDLISQLGIQSHVRLVDRYIPNEDIAIYFDAADLLLLPYVKATQSGIAQIAYALELPVVASRVGGFVDVVRPGKTGYLVDACSPTSIATAVVDFFDHDRRAEMVDHIRAWRSQFTWGTIAEVIERIGDQPG